MPHACVCADACMLNFCPFDFSRLMAKGRLVLFEKDEQDNYRKDSHLLREQEGGGC